MLKGKEWETLSELAFPRKTRSSDSIQGAWPLGARVKIGLEGFLSTTFVVSAADNMATSRIGHGQREQAVLEDLKASFPLFAGPNSRGSKFRMDKTL